MTSECHLSDSDEVLGVWDDAGTNELDTEADVTLDDGQDLPEILMNEIGADGVRPGQHFVGHAVESRTVADEFDAIDVFRQFAMDHWASLSKQWMKLSFRHATAHVLGSRACQLLRRHR